MQDHGGQAIRQLGHEVPGSDDLEASFNRANRCRSLQLLVVADEEAASFTAHPSPPAAPPMPTLRIKDTIKDTTSKTMVDARNTPITPTRALSAQGPRTPRPGGLHHPPVCAMRDSRQRRQDARRRRKRRATRGAGAAEAAQRRRSGLSLLECRRCSRPLQTETCGQQLMSGAHGECASSEAGVDHIGCAGPCGCRKHHGFPVVGRVASSKHSGHAGAAVAVNDDLA